ncbi:DUF6491 family protein [Terricaulis sp.]|uniref:DUF6491 family protein n=1 Tax=Terricaulis sp. TaxID=2768686 RepID=UPI00378437B0
MTAILRTLALAGAALVAACATAETAPAEESRAADYTVVEENARIPETRDVLAFERIDSRSVLLRATGALYIAHVSPSCGLDAAYAQNIAIDRFGPGGVDNHSTLLIEGRRCPIEALSRVERRES